MLLNILRQFRATLPKIPLCRFLEFPTLTHSFFFSFFFLIFFSLFFPLIFFFIFSFIFFLYFSFNFFLELKKKLKLTAKILAKTETEGFFFFRKKLSSMTPWAYLLSLDKLPMNEDDGKSSEGGSEDMDGVDIDEDEEQYTESGHGYF